MRMTVVQLIAELHTVEEPENTFVLLADDCQSDCAFLHSVNHNKIKMPGVTAITLQGKEIDAVGENG